VTRSSSLARSISIALLVPVLVLGSALALHAWKGMPLGSLTQDPTVVGQVPSYAGFVSQVGIFFWAASATVGLFGALVLSRREPPHPLARFLLASGLLNLVLGVDDAFLLHETVLPRLGIPQNLVLGGYVLLVLGYLIAFRRRILETDYLLMAVALGCFAVSVGLDVRPLPGIDPYFIEDGMKLTGIVLWTTYFLRVALRALADDGPARAPEPSPSPSATTPRRRVHRGLPASSFKLHATHQPAPCRNTSPAPRHARGRTSSGGVRGRR